MTIPQLRYLLSLGLEEDRQLWPDEMAPNDDKVGGDQMTSPYNKPASECVEPSEQSSAATGAGPNTIARDVEQVG